MKLERPTPKMGLEETLALTPPSRAEANPVIFSRIATAGEGPALSPRRGGKHAQFPEFSRPLVWNCFMGTHVGCYIFDRLLRWHDFVGGAF